MRFRDSFSSTEGPSGGNFVGGHSFLLVVARGAWRGPRWSPCAPPVSLRSRTRAPARTSRSIRTSWVSHRPTALNNIAPARCEPGNRFPRPDGGAPPPPRPPQPPSPPRADLGHALPFPTCALRLAVTRTRALSRAAPLRSQDALMLWFSLENICLSDMQPYVLDPRAARRTRRRSTSGARRRSAPSRRRRVRLMVGYSAGGRYQRQANSSACTATARRTTRLQAARARARALRTARRARAPPATRGAAAATDDGSGRHSERRSRFHVSVCVFAFGEEGGKKCRVRDGASFRANISANGEV